MILKTWATSSSSVCVLYTLFNSLLKYPFIFLSDCSFFSGETDGIIRTFDLFMAYDLGYFVVEVLARDLAGHSDVTLVGIYILRDDQRVKIVINEIPERVRLFQEEFINLLSNITGAIVNTDDVQVHACLCCHYYYHEKLNYNLLSTVISNISPVMTISFP